jgi:para-aminobenzoate synthetase component 1
MPEHAVAPSRPDPPVVVALPGDVTPVAAWRRLSRLPHVLFLDSADVESPQARYAFVCADPFAWIAAADDAAASAAWQRVAALTAAHQTAPRGDLPPFQGGVAGLLGYELAGAFERLPTARYDDLPVPPLAMGAYDVVAAFDVHSGRGWLVSQGFPELDLQARRERATARAAYFHRLLSEPSISPSAEPTPPRKSLDQLAPQHRVDTAGVTSNLSAAEYRAMVQTGVEWIHAGEMFQVNLAQRLLAPAQGSPLALYERLRARNPAPYAGYFDLGAAQVCSASPECFLTVRDGWAETRPIKGTRPRWRRPEADLYGGEALQASEKDRAENVMIVDLMRNDFSRVCLPESVVVSQLCGLETYAYVQHLVSAVRGRLAPGRTPADLLQACFPAGSITGAPKIRAMQAIAELEPTRRGPYCGALAYLGWDGSFDASVLIRTITVSDGWWQLPVGGGIVAQSDPEAEYRETWHKARGLLAALRA